jgi:two-component system NtrC family response regulator
MNGESKALLIVEDDPALGKQLRWALEEYDVAIAQDRESAIALLRRHDPPVVIMDLGLPPNPDDTTEGMRLLAEIGGSAPDAKVIVLTGQHDRENALKCIALGAYDFYAKPVEPEILSLTVQRAFRLHQLQEENRRLQSLKYGDTFSGILTRDPAMQKICRTVEKVASTTVTVLILGESGTGKELLARAVHDLSPRRERRFVAINCAAIPENLLESELFGFEKGAFTGAVKQTPGKIETAHHGTLFLDEIGDLPSALQAKLLRFLQERVVERIGGRAEIPVDVRIVCATNQDLKQLIEKGLFREDLYYRLAEIVLDVPPLRERRGDASLLAHSFLRRFAEEQKCASMSIRADAVEAIEAHDWPGNIRELENCVKRAVIMAESQVLGPSDFGLTVAEGEDQSFSLRQVREKAELDALVRVMGRTNGNLSKAAQLLGVSRPTLYDLMHRHGLK